MTALRSTGLTSCILSKITKLQVDLSTLLETLRSAGARVVPIFGFHKHSAPLEPDHYLVVA